MKMHNALGFTLSNTTEHNKRQGVQGDGSAGNMWVQVGSKGSHQWCLGPVAVRQWGYEFFERSWQLCCPGTPFACCTATSSRDSGWRACRSTGYAAAWRELLPKSSTPFREVSLTGVEDLGSNPSQILPVLQRCRNLCSCQSLDLQRLI
jgi:hypothetical protein